MIWIFYLLLSIVVMVAGIVWVKVHPFIMITISAILVGTLMGMPLTGANSAVKTITKGMGGTLGSLAFVVAFGVIIGKFLMLSGGGKRIATTMISVVGKKRLNWGVGFAALLIGLPVFFDVGFLLLVPMIITLAIAANVPLMFVAMPFLAGLSVAHGLIPPHPAVTYGVNELGANMEMTILIGLGVSIPTLIVSGIIFGKVISKYVPKKANDISKNLKVEGDVALEDAPSFAVSTSAILLPIMLMVLYSIAEIFIVDKNSLAFIAMKFVGSGFVPLLIGAIYAFIALGLARGLNMEKVGKLIDESLLPTVTILLVTGAGGAFKQVLVDSGITTEISKMVGNVDSSTAIILAWAITALIRISVGSATTAMITGVGIAAGFTGANPVLIVLAIGGGSLILSHVNDSGFWLIKSFFNLSMKETFMTWTLMETILSIMVLIMVLIFNLFIPVAF